MMMLALLLATQVCSSTGDWDGVLTVSAGSDLPLVLHLHGEQNSLDSPNQNALGIPITVSRDGGAMSIAMPSIGARFEGTFSGDCKNFSGLFQQNSLAIKMSFSRREADDVARQPDRPQIPKPPFPYASDEVRIADGPISLAGTLTMPRGAGPFPAVVLIAGSGPQNRDETIVGHPLFLVIADHLTRHGIAVLRYDKRGVGKSTGSFSKSTQKDFTADARAAFSWLRRQRGIDPSRLGLVGHSEGAEIIPAVANSDRHVRFSILLSAPAETGIEIIASQAKAISIASGVPEATANENDALERRLLASVAIAPDATSAKEAAERVLLEAGVPQDQAATQAQEVASPWFRAFLNENPLPLLRTLKVPTLVIAGSKDLQVLPGRNLPLIRRALARNRHATVIELPGLNHLLQPADSGLPAEYGRISTTIDPKVLDIMTDWITDKTKDLPSD